MIESSEDPCRTNEEVLLCERCLKKNKKRKLHLYQINLEEGIFLCPSKQCCYPLEEQDILKFIRKRKYSELGSSSRKLKSDTSKKKIRLNNDVLSAHLKDNENNCRSSFSSGSNDFVDDLMDVSLDVLDMPAKVVNMNYKETKLPFSNEISNASISLSEDAFWNEVFSPQVSHSHIVEVISSISSDGSIGKISDMDDMVTDFERIYPLQNNCQQLDLRVTQQDNLPCNGELSVNSSSLLNRPEIFSTTSDGTGICKESNVQKQENIVPNDVERKIEKEVMTKLEDPHLEESNVRKEKDIIPKDVQNIKEEEMMAPPEDQQLEEACKGSNVQKQRDSVLKDVENMEEKETTGKFVDQHIHPPSESNNSKQLYNGTLSNNPSEELTNNAAVGAGKESPLPMTPEVSDELAVKVQKSQNDGTVLSKEQFTSKEDNYSSVTCCDLDSDRSMPNSAEIYSGLLEQSNNNVPKNKDQISLEVSEMQNVEMIVLSSLVDGNRVYPLWRNSDSLCWLDATLCLLVHNQTLKSHIEQLKDSGDCHLRNVIKTYQKSISIVNNESSSTLDNVSSDRQDVTTLLNNVREDTFVFLQKIMHCTKGKNDSPVFCIPLLLRENKAINELFLMDYWWELLCSNCGKKKIDRNKKTLPTFPSVASDFTMLNASFFRSCFYCEAPQQRRYMRFNKLPDSFMIHFVQGLPEENVDQYDFTFNSSEYKVTAIIQYLTQPTTHFVTWIRNVKGKLWLCCDDLQDVNAAAYSDCPPTVQPSQLHIIMWERQTYSVVSSHVEMESEVQTDQNITELTEFHCNSPQSLITVSSDESDHYDELMEANLEVKGKPSMKENKSAAESCNDSEFSTTEKGVALCSKDTCDQNYSHRNYDEVNNNISQQQEIVEKGVQQFSASPSDCACTAGEPLQKETTSCMNKESHHELNTVRSKCVSESDCFTDNDFVLVEPDNNSNTCITTENIKIFNKFLKFVPSVLMMETNKETIHLPEDIAVQNAEVRNCATEKEIDNTESIVLLKESNVRTYSRKNGFSACNKKTNVNSNQYGVGFMNSSLRKELNGRQECEENDKEANERLRCDTKEPHSPSVPTHTYIKSPSLFKKNEDIDKRSNENVACLTSESLTTEQDNKLSVSLTKSKLVSDEITVKNASSCVKLQNFEQDVTCLEASNTEQVTQNKAVQVDGCEDVSTTTSATPLEMCGGFVVSNGIIPEGRCVEICEEVPIDAPIGDDCISYLVEIEYPTGVTQPTSQFILLNNELNNVRVQDVNHTVIEGSQILPHGTLQCAPVGVLSTSGEIGSATALRKPHSRRKKPMESDSKINKEFRREPGTPLTQKLLHKNWFISEISDPSPKEQRRRKSKEKRSLVKDSLSALDFSVNSPNNVQLLSSLKNATEHKTPFRRGKTK